MQLLPFFFAALLAAVPAGASPERSDNGGPELAYLELVNSQHPPYDPQLLFLLMGRFASHELDDNQRALYLSVIALLRAQHAGQVSLFHRMGYVNETIDMLDRHTGSPATALS